MDPRLLRSFVAVAEELSFRRAAERLHLSQPPLSRQIQALEADLGVRLLERGRARRVALTDAGHTFLTDARLLLATATEARGRVREAARGERGQLRLANLAALSAGVLPEVLSAFRAGFPRVEVHLVKMERPQQLAALREGRVHVGIYPMVGTPPGDGFDSRPFFSCPMVAVVSAGHDLAREGITEIGAEALTGQVLLVPSPGYSPGYADRLQNVRAAVAFTPAAVHPVEAVENLLGMVAAGYGVAVLPEVLVRPAPAAVRALILRAPVPPFQLRLLWRRGESARVLQNFLAVAERVAKGSSGGDPAGQATCSNAARSDGPPLPAGRRRPAANGPRGARRG